MFVRSTKATVYITKATAMMRTQRGSLTLRLRLYRGRCSQPKRSPQASPRV